MKNYADLGGCYPPQPSASADNTLLDLHNSSYHTQPHPIIAKYFKVPDSYPVAIYLFSKQEWLGASEALRKQVNSDWVRVW